MERMRDRPIQFWTSPHNCWECPERVDRKALFGRFTYPETVFSSTKIIVITGFCRSGFAEIFVRCPSPLRGEGARQGGRG